MAPPVGCRRGNLVELAVAFVMGAAFAAVVTAFTAMLLSLLGKAGGKPNFDSVRPGGVPVGAFLTALVSFLIIAAVVYFVVVKPYEAARRRFVRQEEDAAPAEDVQVLKEIRDLRPAARPGPCKAAVHPPRWIPTWLR